MSTEEFVAEAERVLDVMADALRKAPQTREVIEALTAYRDLIEAWGRGL